MKHDIAKLKQLLPLDALIAKLGHAPIAQRQALCPFHKDTRNSFSMYRSNGGFRWKCFAGCGEGDEIDFVHKFFDLPDVKAAIETYAGLVGSTPLDAVQMFSGKVAPAKVAPEPKPVGPPAKMEPLTPAAAIKIGEWRGLSPLFLAEMSDKGIIGLYDNKPAFATEGGVQYRVPGDGWRFSAGAKNSVLVLPSYKTDLLFQPIFVVESNWDALALSESSGTAPVICTRGAANARLAIDYINALSGGESVRVTIIPHNDKPGEQWAADLKAGLMLHEVKAKRVPDPYKDFAEMYKATKK